MYTCNTGGEASQKKKDNNKVKNNRLTPSPTHQDSTQDQASDLMLIDIFIIFVSNLVIKFEQIFLKNTICILFTEIIICNAIIAVKILFII